MKKTVYHGSDHIIERPKYGYGKIYNDYGVGFYCTENQNMAKEWGVSADKNGYANRYEIECDGLKVLNLNMRDYTMLHWLTILLENREFDASTPLAAEAKEYLLQNFHLDYEKHDWKCCTLLCCGKLFDRKRTCTNRWIWICLWIIASVYQQ